MLNKDNFILLPLRFLFIISLTVWIEYETAAGSPGPLDRNTPSGLKIKISFAVAFAGKTVT